MHHELACPRPCRAAASQCFPPVRTVVRGSGATIHGHGIKAACAAATTTTTTATATATTTTTTATATATTTTTTATATATTTTTRNISTKRGCRNGFDMFCNMTWLDMGTSASHKHWLAWVLHPLKLTAFTPLKIGRAPKGDEKVFQPSICQVRKCSFQGG